jgi:hypothetical protein
MSMFWVIRWTDEVTQEDREIVVEAESRLAAETMAIKRNIPVVFIGPAEDADVRAARERKLLWKYTPTAKHTIFGRSVSKKQLVCLGLCGIWTVVMLLEKAHINVLDLPASLRSLF